MIKLINQSYVLSALAHRARLVRGRAGSLLGQLSARFQVVTVVPWRSTSTAWILMHQPGCCTRFVAVRWVYGCEKWMDLWLVSGYDWLVISVYG